MFLYTIVPHEEIFAEEYNPKLQEVVRGEMRLLVTPTQPGQAQIIRVISSNPEDYLRAGYQPGESIELTSADYATWPKEGAEES